MDDRAQFEHMIERIRPLVGVHLNQQPARFGVDTRILTDLSRHPVRRPQSAAVTWGTYYYYTPTYSTLSPEQRWSYIAWLAGDESLGTQAFRQMRLYALCAELSHERRREAIGALRQLYESSAHDAVIRTQIGGILTLAYAATDPAQLRSFLNEHTSTIVPLDIRLRCLVMAKLEAPGDLLLEIAKSCHFRLARGMSNRRPALEAAISEIAARWCEREGMTAVQYVVDHTPSESYAGAYSDTLLMQVARVLSIDISTFAFEQSEAGVFMRGLAAAAQEVARQRKGGPPIDGLHLLDSMLKGDQDASVQVDLSGTVEHQMTRAEEQAYARKLERIRELPGVQIVSQEWDVYTGWSPRNSWTPDSVMIESLPIKQPTSSQPWNAPTPPTFANTSYKALTVEQRWWYLDWIAGEPVEPLESFLALRFKGLDIAYRQHRNLALLSQIEFLFERSQDESLHRAALELLLPFYAELGDAERASATFNRTPITPEQAGRLLGELWAAGGQLDGRGLLHVARAGGFNHTPLTRDHFEAIAERAAELLAEWEADHGPISELPVTSYQRGRRRGTLSGIHVAAEIARQAQEDFKTQRRAAPRTSRMSAEELAAEREELAELPTNMGDGPSEALYQQLSADPQLTATYLAEGVSALEQGNPLIAVAFLRRAAEIAPQSPAIRLLPLARLRLDEWQKQHE